MEYKSVPEVAKFFKNCSKTDLKDWGGGIDVPISLSSRNHWTVLSIEDAESSSWASSDTSLLPPSDETFKLTRNLAESSSSAAFPTESGGETGLESLI